MVDFHMFVLAAENNLFLAVQFSKGQRRVQADFSRHSRTLQIPALWPTGAGELSGSDP